MGIREKLADAGRQAVDYIVDRAADLAKGGPGAASGSLDPHASLRTSQGSAGGSMVPTQEPTAEPQALYWDPFSLVEQLGYKEKPSAITYGTLQAMVWKSPVINAIIQTRVNQVSAFASPQHHRFDTGFRVRLRNPSAKPTRQDRKFMDDMETLLMRTGVTDDPRKRDSLETFLRKVVRDTLTYDQMCHPAGTTVETEKGFKRIEDVQVGDLVRTHKGRLRRVTELKRRNYTGNLYKFKYRGQSLKVTEGHPLLSVGDHRARLKAYAHLRKNTEWVAAEKVQPSHYLVYPKAQIEEVPLPPGADIKVAAFESAQRDKPALPIPDWVMTAPRADRRKFLGEFLKVQGFLYPTSARISLRDRQTFHALRALFSAEGMYLSENIHYDAANRPDAYIGKVSGSAYRRLAEEQGIDVDHSVRIHEPCLSNDDFFLIKVTTKTLEHVVDLPVYNFEVEEDHSYIAEGIVSHNCFEVVHGRDGRPSQFYAVDASTIRLADTYRVYPDDSLDRTKTVQIYDQTIIGEFNARDMAFCVRNPRTDVRSQGYGTSELEMLISTITHLLWSTNYNANFFAQGTVSKGVLNIKGKIPEKQLRAFRRQWYQQISGVENAWRTPMVNADDIEWIDLQKSNRDMEFSAWIDWLIKVATSVYQMDPIEINFKYGTGGAGKSIFDSGNKSKLVESKDKGLKPLLRFLGREIDKYIVHPINPEFTVEFVGLDAQTPKELADLNKERVRSIYTIDEIRAENDLPPLPDGNGKVLLDPVWAQLVLQKEQAAIQGVESAIGMSAPTKIPGLAGSDADRRREKKTTPEDKIDNAEREVEKSLTLEVEL